MTPEQAMTQYMQKLSAFEHHEIFQFPKVSSVLLIKSVKSDYWKTKHFRTEDIWKKTNKIMNENYKLERPIEVLNAQAKHRCLLLLSYIRILSFLIIFLFSEVCHLQYIRISRRFFLRLNVSFVQLGMRLDALFY